MKRTRPGTILPFSHGWRQIVFLLDQMIEDFSPGLNQFLEVRFIEGMLPDSWLATLARAGLSEKNRLRQTQHGDRKVKFNMGRKILR